MGASRASDHPQRSSPSTWLMATPRCNWGDRGRQRLLVIAPPTVSSHAILPRYSRYFRYSDAHLPPQCSDLYQLFEIYGAGPSTFMFGSEVILSIPPHSAASNFTHPPTPRSLMTL